ncbi:hypothetical protein M0R19_02230 [Candidatus Pacearchaeota archaeon]|nr:hypothetical protein [Candidatus Pacearchaeota archaeon]
MGYKIFTLAGCEKCEEVKGYLKKKNFEYEEINAGFGEGLSKLREFYKENRDKIKREKDGTISFPILVYNEKIFQGLEGILNGNI